MTTHCAKFLCCFLSSLFLINGLVIPAQAQRRAIVVNAEQPNVWTLEQAHYLLAQMHRRNLDLRAEGAGTLDANEINGLNFEVLRTLVEFGAIYDDADRFNNSLLRPQRRADAERALRLRARRDELAEDSFRLNREIARLGRQRALATTEEERTSLDAQIAELTGLRDANETSIARLDQDIAASAPSGNVQSTAPPDFTGANRLPESRSFDESFREVTKSLINRFNQAPRLNASLRLDNFLQLQYEIIAKQLTLLRDEVGPGERIIFLEMPQSVNATHDKADKKWAQSWWKVAGYTTLKDTRKVEDTRERSLQRQNKDQDQTQETPDSPREETFSTFFSVADFKNERELVGILKDPKEPFTKHIVSKFSKRTQDALKTHDVGEVPSESLMKTLVTEFNALLLDPSLFQALGSKVILLTREAQDLAKRSPEGEDRLKLNRRLLADVYRNQIRTTVVAEETVTTRKIIEDAIQAFGVNGNGSSDRVRWVPLDPPSPQRSDDDDSSNNEIRIEDRSVRTIDLIPRQGSLNVNDIQLRVRTGVLTAIARTLFGFGANLNVQRQRETFSQFVQQELYSSGFGKGAREFGWTFLPMPGTNRVLSGVKTTYAVMVVPKEAEALVMYANGCVFPRAEYQPLDFQDTLNSRWDLDNNSSRNCGGRKAFVVPIPGGGNEENYDFVVDGLQYVPADKSERVTLLIYGRNFPAQVGLLVDGIPLTQSIGVAQPLIRDDSHAFAAARAELKDGSVLGHFERIDPNQIVAVFERPGGKDGVQPVLTMTAPGKVKILNTLRLNINGTDNAVLNNPPAPLLFGKRPAERDPFRIDKVDLFKDTDPRFLVAAISGAGFRDAAGAQTIVKVLLNGQEISTTNYWVDSPTLLRVKVATPSDDTIKVSLLTAFTTIESSAVTNPGRLRVNNVTVISYDPETDNSPGTIVVKLEGSGFSEDVYAYLNEVAAANALDLIVKSSTEAILKIDNPEAAVIVILEDSQTGQRTKTIITRKKP